MHRLVAFLAVLVLSAAPAVLSAERATLAPDPSYIQIARRFARQFPEEHLRRLPIDAVVSARAWTNYIASLDAERVYLLESDIAALRADELTIGERLKGGDLDFAYHVFQVFLERVKDRHDYVSSLLDKGFDLQQKETYKWKRKDAPWPANKAEWDDLWRRKVENEYVQQIVSREIAAASATNKVEAKEGESKSLLPSPQELIRQRYKQLLIMLNDSDAEWVLQKYLTAFCQAYDPHSSYMSLGSMDDFDIEMKLSLVGIGAVLSSEDGAAKIVELIQGGPADLDKREIKLRPNDKIIAVGEGDKPVVDILHRPLPKIVKLIRGAKGTKVVLTVIPASDPTGSTTKTVDLIRDEVKLEKQAASAKYEDVKDGDGVTCRIGIVTLPTFYANMKAGSMSDDDFKSSAYDVSTNLVEMARQKVDGVILDLRNNGGGALLEAIKLAGLFISTGPIVEVKDKERTPKVLKDLDPDIYHAGPLIVLVNRLSASASEIVAAALQDYGRAIIVGNSKTHGKGTVQTILYLLERDKKMGSIKVTTASYYRINGSSTQLRGVTPNIVIHSPFDYMELGEEYLPNALDLSAESPAAYEPVGDLSAIIPVLRERSEKRRATDPRFIAFAKQMSRIEQINKTQELPLNLDERRTLAKSEQEFSALDAELDAEGETFDAKARDTKHDLVLQETLRIMADYVSLQKKDSRAVESPTAATPAEKKTLAQSIAEWLLNRL